LSECLNFKINHLNSFILLKIVDYTLYHILFFLQFNLFICLISAINFHFILLHFFVSLNFHLVFLYILYHLFNHVPDSLWLRINQNFADPLTFIPKFIFGSIWIRFSNNPMIRRAVNYFMTRLIATSALTHCQWGKLTTMRRAYSILRIVFWCLIDLKIKKK